MPRMRRKALERRKRPLLDAAIYRWLIAGRPDQSTLPLRTRWDTFVLEGRPVHEWECSHDPNYVVDRTAVFWDGVLQKIRSGEIEVAEDVDHNTHDLPLASEEEALSFLSLTK